MFAIKPIVLNSSIVSYRLTSEEIHLIVVIHYVGLMTDNDHIDFKYIEAYTGFNRDKQIQLVHSIIAKTGMEFIEGFDLV